MRNLRWAVFLIITVVALRVAGQEPSVGLSAPYGPANSLASPDGAYRLYGDEESAQLWLVDVQRHDRRPVLHATVPTLTLAWSPDSQAFIVNDHMVSNMELAYVYDAKTLVRLDLRSRILAADPQAAHFIEPGQGIPEPVRARDEKIPTDSFVHALRWMDASHVVVQLTGHTAGINVGGVIHGGDCFDLRYQVSRNGAVQKISRHIFPINNRVEQDCAELNEP